MSDPYFSSVVLLAFNDNAASGTQTYLDQSASAHTLTGNGGTGKPTYSTLTAPTGMTSSVLFVSANSQFITSVDSADWAFGSGDFTVEAYLLITSAANSVWACQWLTSGSQKSWLWRYSGVAFDGFYSPDGGAQSQFAATTTTATGSWHHVALCRDGANVRMFVDGIQTNTTFNIGAASLFDSNNVLTIGRNGDTGNNWPGNMCSLRITKGIARYKANFTPPSLPFPTTAVDPPVADFTGTPTSGTAPLSVAFTDLSTNTPTSWAWDFGDGNTSTQQNPTHSYASAGTYTVKLTATNAAGSDTKTATNYITVTAATTQPNTGGGYRFTPFIPRRPRSIPKGKVNKQQEPIIPVLVEEPNKVIHVVWKPVIPEADYSEQIKLFQRAMESVDAASKSARMLAELQAEHMEKVNAVAKDAKRKKRKKRILQIAQILDELT